MFWIVAAVSGGLVAVPVTAQSTGFSTGTTSTNRSTATSMTTTTVDAGTLLGLKPASGAVSVVTLTEAITEALERAPDARIAAERVLQSEAARRRSWALLLPSLSVGANYTHTCMGGQRGVDCGDRTASFADPDSIQQQALLFQTLADVMGVAADAATTPEDEANFRARQVELTAAADDIKNTDLTPVVVQPAMQVAGQVTLTVPLLNPRAYPALLNAIDGVDAAELARDQARQALVFSVVRAYYAAVTAERVRQASERQVELARVQRDAVAARVQAATQPALAEKRASLELLRAQQTLAQTSVAVDNAIGVLGMLIGRTETFQLAPPPPLAALSSTLATASSGSVAATEALVEQAYQTRLELKTQRTMVTIAERSVLDAWAQFLPTIGVSASARATSFTTGFVRDPVTGVLNLSATLPLYDGGARYASLEDGQSRVREETIRLRQLEDRVAAQVRGSARDVAVRTEAAQLAASALVIAKEAQAQAQALFDAGVGTALDVTETNVAVFGAETDVLRTELELAMSQLGLRFVVGEPLQTDAVAEAPSSLPSSR
jgi:outer membrane protein TolC